MFFFGRERDVEIVCANALAARLTVLYGPSGVGKSSLLAAAVTRQLRELPERPVVVFFASWSDRPAAAIAAAVCSEAAVEPTDSLTEAVARACEARGEVYLLLDQAEEYFLYHPEGGPLRPDLAALVAGSAAVQRAALAPGGRAREARPLQGVDSGDPGQLPAARPPLARRPAALRSSIPSSAGASSAAHRWRSSRPSPRRFSTRWPWARVRAGLGGSGRGGRRRRCGDGRGARTSSSSWSGSGRSSGPRGRSSCVPPLSGGWADAEQIVAAHLERAMDALTPVQQRVASDLLRQLVTPSGAKIAHAAADLAGYANVPQEEARDGSRRPRRPAHPAPGGRGALRDLPRRPRGSGPRLAGPLRARTGARRGAPSQPQARRCRHCRRRRARPHGARRRLRPRPAQQRPLGRACRACARARCGSAVRALDGSRARPHAGPELCRFCHLLRLPRRRSGGR